MKSIASNCFNGIYADKRVLILGHTGFKGSWLWTWLERLGASVHGIALNVPTEPSLASLTGIVGEASDFRVDIRDGESLRAAVASIQPEIVFHLAAKAIVRECYENPKDAFETNLLGTVNVLEAIRSCPSIRSAVIITSDKCYENVEWEYGYREDDLLGGKDPYSASKACAEIAFSSYFRSYFQHSSVRLATARAGNVIGGGDWALDRIVPDCMRAWSTDQPLTIRSPHATRPWQHVLEPLSGYLWLAANLYEAKSNVLNGEAFNFGPDSDVVKTVAEIIEQLKKVWKDGTYVVDQAGVGAKKEASLLKLCCDKALHRLSWRPVLNFEQTMAFTGEWYFEFYKSGGSAMKAYTRGQIETYEQLAAKKRLIWTAK